MAAIYGSAVYGTATYGDTSTGTGSDWGRIVARTVNAATMTRREA